MEFNLTFLEEMIGYKDSDARTDLLNPRRNKNSRVKKAAFLPLEEEFKKLMFSLGIYLIYLITEIPSEILHHRYRLSRLSQPQLKKSLTKWGSNQAYVKAIFWS